VITRWPKNETFRISEKKEIEVTVDQSSDFKQNGRLRAINEGCRFASHQAANLRNKKSKVRVQPRLNLLPTPNIPGPITRSQQNLKSGWNRFKTFHNGVMRWSRDLSCLRFSIPDQPNQTGIGNYMGLELLKHTMKH
jgi:hypothetical protein